MSYHIYTTDALILSERPLKEADRIYSILTRDFGLVRATAGGVRKEVSKLRPSLEPMSFSSVSFVRGKEDWRITSAILEYDVEQAFEKNKEAFLSVVRALSLLEKLIAGEESHPELIDEIKKVIEFAKNADISGWETELEIILVARILFQLGYLSGDDVPKDVLTEEVSLEMLKTAQVEKKSIVHTINSGIQASGLVS